MWYNYSTFINNYAFIDSQNLYIGTKKLGWKIDYKKLRKFLKDKFFIAKAFIFIGYINKNEKLYKFLTEAGFVLIFKPTITLKTKGKFIKGNVDAELVLHTMINLHKFDNAIIITSDGDFYCLIEFLVNKSKLLKLITTNPKFSSLLKKYA